MISATLYPPQKNMVYPPSARRLAEALRAYGDVSASRTFASFQLNKPGHFSKQWGGFKGFLDLLLF